jgi:hypothetical protein
MNSIGNRNIELVKNITREEMKNGKDGLHQRVYDRIPQSVFDIYLMAYQEIDGIIFDVVTGGEDEDRSSQAVQNV